MGDERQQFRLPLQRIILPMTFLECDIGLQRRRALGSSTIMPSLAGFGIGISLEAVDALLARFHPLDLLLVRHQMNIRSGIKHQIV
jgi:hypothetical protein